MVSGRVAQSGRINCLHAFNAGTPIACGMGTLCAAITEDVVGRGMPAYPGLFDPAFLALHFIGTSGAHRVFGTNDTYAYVLIAQWKFTSYGVALQTGGLLAAWIHGCLGLYFWLRLKPWFNAITPLLFALAILIPVGSWIGFYAGGKEALALYENPEWRRLMLAEAEPPNTEGVRQIYDIAFVMRVIICGLVGLALSGRVVRYVLERRSGTYLLQYPDDKTIRSVSGTTILEASRLHGIPHAAVCGGRGRCSTCRVRVLEGEEYLPEPSADEVRVLEKGGRAPEGPACLPGPCHRATFRSYHCCRRTPRSRMRGAETWIWPAKSVKYQSCSQICDRSRSFQTKSCPMTSFSF